MNESITLTEALRHTQTDKITKRQTYLATLIFALIGFRQVELQSKE